MFPTCGFFLKKGYQHVASDGDATAEIPTVKLTVRFEIQRSLRVAHSVAPSFRKCIIFKENKAFSDFTHANCMHALKINTYLTLDILFYTYMYKWKQDGKKNGGFQRKKKKKRGESLE